MFPPPSTSKRSRLRAPSSTAPGSPRNRAFALVSVLIMVVLLTFVLVALLSLLRMENQAGGNTILRNQAQQNALAGLDLALAELQSNLGPDQRISASAGFLDTDPETELIDGVDQPYWTGVWDAARWDGTGTKFPADYYDKSAKFRRWLVSAPTAATPEEEVARMMDTAKAPDLDGSNSVVLVGEGTVKPNGAGQAGEVRAWIRDGDIDSAGRQGRYAWWVGDEGVKARLNLQPNAEGAAKEVLQASLAAAPRTALEAVEEFKDMRALPADLAKTLTFPSLALSYQENGEPGDFGSSFHDFTVYSMGVQADAQRGGLKKDLSLALELPRAELPDFVHDAAEGVYRKIYSRSGIAPATPAKTATNAAEGPDWGLIHRHYSYYKLLKQDPDGVYVFETDPYNRQIRQEYNRVGQIDPRNVRRDYILPLVHRTQLVFGLYRDRKYYWRNNASDPQVVYMSFYPALHLWNPYNVRIRSEQAPAQVMQQVWHFPTPPLEVSFNGGSTWRSMRNIFWDYGGTLVTLNFGGGFGSPKVPYIMEPGALAVYGPETQNPALNNRFYSGEGAHRDSVPGAPIGRRSTDMRTGWDPLGPFHSFSLGSGPVPSETDAIKVADVSSLNLSVRYFAPNQIDEVAIHRMLETEGADHNGYYNMVGIHELNTQGDTANPNLFKTYQPSDFPQITAASLSDKDNPFYLFSYDWNFKIFPGETELKSKYGFFTDPTESNYLLETQNLVNALSSPFELTVTPLTGGPTTTDGRPHVKVDPNKSNQGYLGELSEGINTYTWKEIPTMPMVSLGQLQHVQLGLDYAHPIYQVTRSIHASDVQNQRQLPAATFARPFANSYSHPRIPLDSAIDGISMDHCVHTNHALADGYFFSTIAPQSAVAFTAKRNVRQVSEDWFAGTAPLLNTRFVPYMAPGEAPADAADRLLDGTNIRRDAALSAAANLMALGSFNVNSLSEDAWVAILGGNFSAQVPYMPPAGTGSTGVQLAAAEGFPVSRVNLPNGLAAGPTNPNDYWKGFNDLTEDQLREIAKYLVREIKTRGPFLNLADFLNREVSTRAPQNALGAVQAAIEAAKINEHAEFTEEVTSADLPTTPAPYANPAAATGPVGSGIPGYVTQADLLTPVLPSLAARSDTFTIRSYGEVVVRGKVQSRAWCEAVVQRTPDFMDATDAPGTAIADLTSDANQKFGRRFRVIQFRWLSPDEV